MLEKEIIEVFKMRYLNTKVNNYIFTGIDDFRMLDNIPYRCNITMPDDDIKINIAENIRIDMKEVDIRNILSYTLDILKGESSLDFNSIFFNANSFIKGNHFQSYSLLDDRILDGRENYERIKLLRI